MQGDPMGTMPVAGHRNEGGAMPRLLRHATPPAAPRREMAAWGCFARPSLKPTIFAPSRGAPADSASEEVAARKV
jgi:hypothetical protein